MAVRHVTPILLLTGFLGSGKTTLLSQWLKSPLLAEALVIVNELGAIGIDDQLIQTSSETPILLENGCACCTAGDDLTATLERLFWDRLQQNRKTAWVIIETTGIADPHAILEMLGQTKLLAERYRIGGIVTVFDACHGPAQAAAHPECRHQLEAASSVILSKLDLASPSQQDAARAAIRAFAPSAAILASSRGALTAEEILSSLKVETSHVGHHHHHHDHDHEDHLDGITTAFLPLPGPLPSGVLKQAVQTVIGMFGDKLLRLKGIVALDDGGAFQTVQVSGGGDTAYADFPGNGPTVPRVGIAIISQYIDAAYIADCFADCLGRPDLTPLETTRRT